MKLSQTSFLILVALAATATSAAAQPAAPPAVEPTAQPAAPPAVEPATPPAAPPATPPAAPPATPPAAQPSGPTVKLDGYVEVHYSRNFNEPSNGITNFRGFDNRHDTFTLSNAVLGGTFDYESLSGRLALQIGHTPGTYYLAEPLSPGAGGAAGTSADVFKYIQQAYAGWKAPLGRGLLLQGGVFLSPIGYEGMAVKDNWNWSRSDLFFGLPCCHTGLRATYEATDRLTVMAVVCNGWNSVVDNNDHKSIEAQVIYKVPDRLTLSVLYFGGNERPKGAPEGEPWRNLFDVWAQLDATRWLSFAAQANAGFEQNTFGTSYWGTGALYARVQPASWLYLAARGDVFREHAASNADGTASRIFWPADTVGSATLTADLRPHSNVSFRLEYRHDQADGDMFFAGTVAGDGTTTPYVANARSQDTLTAGLTAWF